MADKIHVAIIGGGLGGLMLAICLERAQISYQVYEKSLTVSPLGSAITLGGNSQPMLQQLGLLDEIRAIGKPIRLARLCKDDTSLIGTLDYAYYEERYGYIGIVMSRMELYKVLLSRIPKEKISYGKKMVDLVQDSEKATLTFEDKTIVDADVVVGADGAYSGVRQKIYQDLQNQGKMVPSDLEPLLFNSTCLVGTTRELDTTRYPQLLEEETMMDTSLSVVEPYTWNTFSVPGNKICYMILRSVDPATLVKNKQSESGNVEKHVISLSWGNVESTEQMIKDTRHFQLACFGGTFGDLIDQSDVSTISVVALEEKLFETWSHGRVVLLGDAAHKFTPSAGQGAVQSFLDAGSIASHLNDLTDISAESLGKAFAAYKSDRYELAKMAIEASQANGALFNGRTWYHSLMRTIVLNWLPKSMVHDVHRPLDVYKPQLTFLPFVEKRGTHPTRPENQQQSSRMALPTLFPATAL